VLRQIAAALNAGQSGCPRLTSDLVEIFKRIGSSAETQLLELAEALGSRRALCGDECSD